MGTHASPLSSPHDSKSTPIVIGKSRSMSPETSVAQHGDDLLGLDVFQNLPSHATNTDVSFGSEGHFEHGNENSSMSAVDKCLTNSNKNTSSDDLIEEANKLLKDYS